MKDIQKQLPTNDHLLHTEKHNRAWSKFFA